MHRIFFLHIMYYTFKSLCSICANLMRHCVHLYSIPGHNGSSKKWDHKHRCPLKGSIHKQYNFHGRWALLRQFYGHLNCLLRRSGVSSVPGSWVSRRWQTNSQHTDIATHRLNRLRGCEVFWLKQTFEI